MSALTRIGYAIGAVAATIVGGLIVNRVDRSTNPTPQERERWMTTLEAELAALPTAEKRPVVIDGVGYNPALETECCDDGECTATDTPGEIRDWWNGYKGGV